MFKVSAVIPTRGRPQLVSRAVESVLGQTYLDVEVVVVIDGDDPLTFQHLQQINDSRLRVVHLKESVGGSEARNTGAREASGHWVALLDDDDVWLPEKIEKQVRQAQRSSARLTLLTSRFIARFEDREEVWPQRFPRRGENLSEYLFCFPRNVFQTSTLMCTRDLMLEEPFLKGLKRLQDWDWLLRVAARGDVDLITNDEPLSIYYVDGQGATISKKPDWTSSYQWAQENRSLMTPRAYAYFIAKKCAPDAAKQRVGWRTVLMLLRECAFTGSGSIIAPGFFLLYFMLPHDMRQRLGYRISSLLRLSRKSSPDGAPEKLVSPRKWRSSHENGSA
ncbi:MAG TPA: glycosyltransferase family 2 protein [Acidisarcina sp.]